MNRKLWSVFTLCLVGAMLFASCSGNNGTSNNKSTSNNTTSSSNNEVKSTPEVKEKPVTIVYGAYNAPTDTIDNFVDTPVGQQILKELNIIVKIRGAQEFDQAFVADVAANNLPDILAFGVNSIRPEVMHLAQRAAKEGLLADLSGALEKEGPILKEALDPNRMPLFVRDFVFDPSFEEKIYFLPDNYSTSSPTINGFVIFVRGDIAKALNIDPKSIKTEEDLYNLAVAIKNGGFKDINGQPIYPIGTMSPTGASGVWPQINYSLFRAFDYGKTGVALVDGKLQGYANSEEAWNQILFARKLVADGLLDPESIAHTLQSGLEKVAQGKYGILPLMASRVVPGWQEPIKSLLDSNPEMEYIGLDPLYDYKGSDVAVMNIGGEGSQAVAVSKGANVEAAVKLLNWINSKEGRATAMYGVQGEHWDFTDEGYAKMKDDAYASIIQDLNAYKKTIGGEAMGVGMLLTGVGDPKYDIFGGTMRNKYFQNNPTFIEKTAEFIEQVMPKYDVLNKVELSYLFNSFPGKDQLQPVIQQQNEVFGRAYLVKTEKEARDIWDGYRETLAKNGYNDYIQFLQEKYDEDPNAYALFVSNL